MRNIVWAWIWAIGIVVVLILVALVYGGVVTQAQIENFVWNASDGFVWVIALAFAAIALPLLLVAVVLLITHGKGTAGRVVLGGLLCAVVAGLVHFGAWDTVKKQGGSWAQTGGGIAAKVGDLSKR